MSYKAQSQSADSCPRIRRPARRALDRVLGVREAQFASFLQRTHKSGISWRQGYHTHLAIVLLGPTLASDYLADLPQLSSLGMFWNSAGREQNEANSSKGRSVV
jgi:hypothetical protein